MQFDVIPMQLTPAAAELALVAVPEGEAAGLALHGRLVGPRCHGRETIEIAYPVKPSPAEGDVVRAKVVIPEPSFWSPAAPFLYEAKLELRRADAVVEEATVAVGLKELLLHPKKGLRLNGQRFRFAGAFGRGFSEDEALALRAEGVDLLVVPVKPANLPLWPLANRLGFFVLGVIDPEDDALLWEASETLARQPAALGWLLPQALIGQPQRWHNAVSLLHGQRRDLFIGIKAESAPLGALPGHVAFAMAEPDLLEALAGEGLPGLALLPRGGAAPADLPALLGTVRRA